MLTCEFILHRMILDGMGGGGDGCDYSGGNCSRMMMIMIITIIILITMMAVWITMAILIALIKW